MNDLRASALDFLRSLRETAPHGLYRCSPTVLTPDLYGTCFAVLLRSLLLDEIATAERDEFASMIRSYQQERTGMFVDPQVPPDDTAERTWSFISIEMTHLCLAALAELEIAPPHPLRVMRLVGRNAEGVRNWLGQIQWMHLWPPPPSPQCKLCDMADWNGQEILHFGGALIKAAEFGDAFNDAVEAMMNWLDEAVDPDTGLWGTNHGCSRANALLGAGAIARLYFYLNRPLKFPVDVAGAVDAQLVSAEPDTLRATYLRCVSCALHEKTDWNLRGHSAQACWHQRADS